MKTIILIFILFASQSFAQITLTSANNPVAGDISHNTSCDTTNITQGNSGSNQVWSFLNLIGIDSSSIGFVAAASTPYAAQFPTSNIAAGFDSIFSYYTTSSANFLFNGTAAPVLLSIYNNPQLILQYPFTYTTSFTDNFSATSTISGFQSFKTGTTTATGDAWGTINLPIGQFQNALRVKYVTISRDSSTLGSVSTTSVTSYSWFVSGRKFPIFEVGYFSFEVNGIPFVENSKSVNYAGSAKMGISNISNETPENYMLSQNYPNPFNPTTKLRFAIPKSGFVKLTVFDELGREIETLVNGQLTNGSYEVDWNASRYSSGVYFYKLETSEFIETKKMILNK